MSRPEDHQPLKNPPKVPRPPIPSSSVLLVSPSNQILLLHRVRTSSSFASAHVFPGGALSAEHDGEIPAVDSLARHEDGKAYRLAAIRETFEESGILLAKNKTTGRLFTEIGDQEREEGRKAVHSGKIMFLDWLGKVGAVADTDALIPLTRWITPANVPKRFTTQMYLYFLPLPTSPSSSSSSPLPPSSPASPISTTLDPDEIIIPTPTPDGGIEHTAARFLPAAKWLALARAARILLFPPQFFLLHLLAPYLARSSTSPTSPLPPPAALQAERDALLKFLNEPAVYDGEREASWADAAISPRPVVGLPGYGDVGQGATVLGLEWAGPEVERQGKGRRGVKGWVVVARFAREGPREVEVVRREEVVVGGRGGGGKL
ncbi:uncharacterized protein BDZ99DRAFT_376042 [Mytilinidion resinicola]|uniref:Nudix hydrolase domain-containing protein n=1 Tax=Mytilinidion resinicola TaxID=574789 RepID=A0A6A6Z6R0_9PEZI|nr:uncharacterized protein BDZ99DRAFT_376042 [Mytilinidion resinicola]KAF2815984.1 hypothetical protein BDZ99DRAFT_376042 [Mytilinidion resinicola]